MNKVQSLIEKLKNPDREFSPMPFWFLNDELSDDEIVRQLREFNDKGVCGVVLHPRIGMPTTIEYLSDDYMHFIKLAVKTASELDMKIILYDEAMYPSGSAHGLVVKHNPKFASQAIILADDMSEGKLIAKTKSGKYIIQVDSKGTMRGLHYGEDDNQPNAPLTADLLNKESVGKFIDITYERYYSVLKEYFGSTVIGFFTDEPSLLGRCHREGCMAWTWGLEDVITSLGGELSELEGLFTGDENMTVKLYNKVIFERENEIYYKSLSMWCEEHNIALMGHPHQGDDIECERFFHIPGQDLVLRWISPENNRIFGLESAQAKCSSDAARCMGRRRNSNECYGGCCKDDIPWNFSGGDLKWYTDWLGVRGVNFFIPHAFYYSVVGDRKNERPPDVGPNNIWWKYYEVISTYIKRISCLMTDSVNKAKICVLCENRKMPVDEVAWFYENQVEFNYLPYSFISENAVKDGKICVADNEYEYVFGDYKQLFSDIKEIKDFADFTYRDIYTDKKCKNLRVSHIVKDEVEAFFLTNEGEDVIDTMATVKGSGGLISMDFWSGEVKPLSVTNREGMITFNLKLKRRESVLILIDEDYTQRVEVSKPKEYVQPEFILVNDDTKNFVKTYRAVINLGRKENLYISLQAEEMVECFVNDNFAGFSLWNEHEFYISPHLVDGENTIELKITGSAVNIYTDERVEYGLL